MRLYRWRMQWGPIGPGGPHDAGGLGARGVLARTDLGLDVLEPRELLVAAGAQAGEDDADHDRAMHVVRAYDTCVV